MSFDFDRPIDRTGTAALKWDARRQVFGREDLIPLWVADMDFAAPEQVTQALVERARHPIYGYSLHPDSLFEALADWLRERHHWHIERDWVLWVPGVVPSLNAAVLSLTQPGEGVIVQPPVYPPFFSAVTTTGRGLVENPLIEVAGRYQMDLDHLEHCAAQGAKLLLLCSPHNPVGRVWTEDELQAVLTIARRHGLTILSDEIHHDLIYPGVQHTPLARLTGNAPDIVSAVAPSKTFNIPGLGLSALIAPDPERRAKLKAAFDQLHIIASNPFSMTAFAAAYRHGGPWLDALRAYLANSRDFALDFVARRLPGVRAIAPQGTYLLWLDCRGLNLQDPALQRLLVDQARVGLSPGVQFGIGGQGHMRLNLGAPRALIAEALERIAGAL